MAWGKGEERINERRERHKWDYKESIKEKDIACALSHKINSKFTTSHDWLYGVKYPIMPHPILRLSLS